MNPVLARQKRFQPVHKPLLAAILFNAAFAASAQSSVPADLTVEKPAFAGQNLKRNHTCLCFALF